MSEDLSNSFGYDCVRFAPRDLHGRWVSRENPGIVNIVCLDVVIVYLQCRVGMPRGF